MEPELNDIWAEQAVVLQRALDVERAELAKVRKELADWQVECKHVGHELDVEREKVNGLEALRVGFDGQDEVIEMKKSEYYALRDSLATLQAQLAAAQKVKADYDRWLSGGVYFTTAEYEKHVADHRQLVEALQAQIGSYKLVNDMHLKTVDKLSRQVEALQRERE